MARESAFQGEIIKDLHREFPTCLVLKNDANYIQGFPDLLVLYDDNWAALECKAHDGARRQPNQEYYVDRLRKMSYAAFICPENKEKVLDELRQAFSRGESTRIFKP